jgi:hypothetical protein
MTKDEFEFEIYTIIEGARLEELDSGEIYEVLNFQALIAETILRLDIEKAYKQKSF